VRPLRALVPACLLGLALALPSPGVAAEPARPADAFVDSIGVNVHMNYTDTVYRDGDLLIDKLATAGIRHVRDGLSWDTEYAYRRYEQLRSRGIGVTFIMGDAVESHDTLEELLTVLRSRVRNAAEAVEGPNEYSYSGDPLWSSHLRAYQTRLHSSIKADPALASLPVLAPSLITWQDHAELGDMTSALDAGNKHPYPGGDIPEANLTEELSVAARVSGDRPVWVTETGYHNALATESGHRPASEAAAATYIPRMFLENFRRGIPRTFSYELVDLWPDPDGRNQEAHFGMLRNDYSEKPVFRRVANLTALLSDPGPAHSASPLDLTIEGGPADLRRLLLQKRDGSYSLVLWRAARVWDPVARRPLNVAADDVRLRLGQTAAAGFRAAELIDPTRGTEPVRTTSAGSPIDLPVGADPVVVRLVPLGVAPDTGPTAPGGDGSDVPATGAGPAAGGLELSVTRGQTLGGVLRRGLAVKCRLPRGRACKATAAFRDVKVAAGGGSLDVSGAARVRLRVSGRGAKVLRRAASRRRTVRLEVRAAAGGAVVVRKASIRR
jgi:hypothetical protein